jgi:predicted GTPase
MPYGDLLAQRVQRFATLADLARERCTIEEMEEYEPHLEQGTVVYAGVDYADILERASAEADVILWDGGNNDLPFYRPTLHVVVADPLRLGNELTYLFTPGKPTSAWPTSSSSTRSTAQISPPSRNFARTSVPPLRKRSSSRRPRR